MTEDPTARVAGQDENSREAYKRQGDEVRQTQRDRICEALKFAKDGMTAKELEMALELGHNTVSSRLIEAMDLGLVNRPGKKRRGAWIHYLGPGPVKRRKTKDGVPREKYEAMDRFLRMVRITIERGRLSGPGLEGMDTRMRELGY